jgi:hypothetical protein
MLSEWWWTGIGGRQGRPKTCISPSTGFVFSVKDSLHQPKCALQAVQRMATSGMTFRFVDDHRGLRFSSLSTPNRVPAALDTARCS